ncbi:hypothetical protein Nepgr_008364 [Nepenthes gracilis]|uniref:Uncharacterized protein n=1 Tax=Nepenthes gracilis TaxID=150966 RepID=A0AAD3XJ74_NEPGR|nr:hypothetical protein Nepgr_008364 [Nepenthes gracilis]
MTSLLCTSSCSVMNTTVIFHQKHSSVCVVIWKFPGPPKTIERAVLLLAVHFSCLLAAPDAISLTGSAEDAQDANWCLDSNSFCSDMLLLH